MRFAVIGDPVAHSKSPAMHMAAYKALGMDHTYGAIRATAEDLPRLVEALRAGAYDGFNVTVPHKTRVRALAAWIDVSAGIGAANTLVRNDKGEVGAYNTDVYALESELRRLAPSRTRDQWQASRAIVLGTGGAALAALQALGELGVRDIVVRTRQGESFHVSRLEFGGALMFDIRALKVEPLAPSAADAGALTVIQATSAGMQGADPGDAVAAAVGWNDLPAEAIALDVIYAPPETPFLAAARARGLRHTNGLGMLVEQGAIAFKLWLGVEPPRDVMLAALR